MTNDMEQRHEIRRRRRLVRPAAGRSIAGVASGLAEHFDISAAWVKLAFVVLSFFGGLGIVLYIVGWLVIPDENEGRSIAENAFDDADSRGGLVAIGLIAVAGLVALGSISFVAGEVVLAGALFFVGLLLYRGGFGSSDNDVDSIDASPPADSILEAARAEVDQIGDPNALEPFATHSTEVDSGPPTTQTPQPSTVRARSYLGRMTLALSLIAVGVLALLDSLDVFDPSLAQYGAVMLASIGVGLLVGSLAGRALWLIIPGLFLIPVLLVASLVDIPLASSSGEFTIRPTSVEALQPTYEFGGADVRLDLTELGQLTEDKAVQIDMFAGQLRIIAPDSVNLVANVDVVAGEIVGSGDRRVAQAGVLVDDRIESVHDEGPVLDLSIDLAFGSVQVEIIEAE